MNFLNDTNTNETRWLRRIAMDQLEYHTSGCEIEKAFAAAMHVPSECYTQESVDYEFLGYARALVQHVDSLESYCLRRTVDAFPSHGYLDRVLRVVHDEFLIRAQREVILQEIAEASENMVTLRRVIVCACSDNDVITTTGWGRAAEWVAQVIYAIRGIND